MKAHHPASPSTPRAAPRGREKAFTDDDREPDINADFTRPVGLATTAMAWQPSPAAGVWRKRLELIAGDPPRLTTIVRFEAGSAFDEHGHPRGEEFLVLRGTFSDASGDFPAGSYVRNPPGWRHAPYTETGCELFVKLCQFHEDDTARVVVDGRNAPPRETASAALTRRPLHDHGSESVALYDLAPGARAVPFDCPQGAELLVLEGGLEVDTAHHPEGSWLRYPAGTRLHLGSSDGCRFYGKTGLF